jgi:hypothetical protein
MKPKDELLGDYRDLAENNALQKDGVFLEVLIGLDHGVGHFRRLSIMA